MTSSDILQWDDTVLIDEGIEEYEYRRYPPDAGGVAMLNNPGQIRFSIESGDIFTHPHRSYIQFIGRLTKDDDSAYEKADLVTIANNGLMYLFNQIRYEIGGREMETLLFPGQATTMLGLLEYSDDFSVSKALAQCWFKDHCVFKDDGTEEAANALSNQGFKARQNLLLASNQGNADTDIGKFTFNVPLSHIFGFCKDYDKVLYGVKQELIFTRKVDGETIFKANAAAAGKITLDNMYWFVPIVKPSISNLNTWMGEMAKNINIKIGYDQRQVFSVGLPVNNTSYTWNLTTKAANEKPRFLIVGIQRVSRTSQNLNPSSFTHEFMSRMHVYLNNVKRYPALDFITDFSTNHYMDVYTAAANFKCLVSGVPSCVSNSDINPLDFKTPYPLFVFDLSKQSATLKTSITNITVEMLFNKNIEADTKAYAVLLSDKVLSFQSDGKEIQPVY